MKMTITIPGTPPRELSPNASLFLKPGHKHKIRKQWQADWYACAYQSVYAMRHGVPVGEWAPLDDWDYRKIIFSGPTRCQITVYRGKGAKPWDADNLLAACKYGLDQLQMVGVIENDRLLSFPPIRQERDPEGRGYTLVELSDEEE